MKILKYIFIISAIVAGGFSINRAYAQPNTLSYMKGIPQTKDINPALYSFEKGFYISMPGFSKADISLSTNGFTYSDLIHKGTGSYADSLVLDLERFHSKLDRNNFIMGEAAYTPLEFGFRADKNFFSLSLSLKGSGETFFGRNLVSIIKDGNAPYIGELYNSGELGGKNITYKELALNFGRNINEKLTVGFTAKILSGVAGAKTRNLALDIFTPEDGSYIDMSAAGEMYFSSPEEVYLNSDNKIDSLFSESGDFGPLEILTTFNNLGFAFDLGASYQLTDKLQLSASVTDLGYINWHENAYKCSVSGNTQYEGIDISNSLDSNSPDYKSPSELFSELSDSLLDELFDYSAAEEKFKTFLPAKIYLGADYNLNDYLSVGGLARLRCHNNRMSYAFTTSLNAKAGRVMNLSVSHSVIDGKANFIGAGIGLRGGPFQVYAVADNILTTNYLRMVNTNAINARVGINFIFGDKKKKDEECATCPKPVKANAVKTE